MQMTSVPSAGKFIFRSWTAAAAHDGATAAI